MRLILQRVSRAAVSVNNGEAIATGPGLMILAGICPGDTESIAEQMAVKAVNLRIFDDENGLMNRSLLDCKGDCLVVSNFTLYANSRKGRRPSFTGAAPPSQAKPLYEYFLKALRRAGAERVQDGEFGAMMRVEIHNEGPVTIILDSDEVFPRKEESL